VPRIEVADYICLKRPRPTQGCRADDDDDDDDDNAHHRRCPPTVDCMTFREIDERPPSFT